MRGSIKKRGDTYTIVVDTGKDPNTGKRKQKRISGFKTKPEAEAKLAELLNEVNKGTYIEPAKITIAEQLEKWLESYGRQNLAPATFESYQNIINRHLIPHLGNIPLQKLLPEHIEKYYADKLSGGRVDNKKNVNKGLSSTTVLYHHRVLREALQHAFMAGKVGQNVCDRVKPPRKEKKKYNLISEEEVPKLLELFNDEDNKYLYMPVYLAITTGMRAGEILALRWDNVDLKNGIIHVNSSLRQRKKDDPPEFQDTKNTESNRPIEIYDETIKTLKEHKKIQASEKLACKNSYINYNLVCCLQNGEPINPGTLSSRFHKIARKNGFNIRFHDLRHAHATFLLKLGTPPKIVAERLGHSTIRLTMDTYSHVVPGMQRQAAQQYEELLFKNGCDQSVTTSYSKEK